MGHNWAGKEDELNRRLRETSRSGHGVITTEDLFRLGVSRGMIQTRANTGRLVPVLKRVYALPGSRLDPRGRYRAAVCSAGPNVHLSHRSALGLHGLLRDTGPVHLVGRAGAFRIEGSRRWSSREFGFEVECHQTRYLPEEHIIEVDGIRVTTVERALRDFASQASAGEISKALTQGEKEGSFCWTKLRKLVAASSGHRGLDLLRKEIEEWDPRLVDAASDPEADFLLMLRRQSLPFPVVNAPMGNFVVDFLWSHLRLAVELDPWSTHKGRESYRRDHRKGVELEVAGLRVIRFTGEDLYLHEERTAAELLSLMTEQSRSLGVPLFTR